MNYIDAYSLIIIVIVIAGIIGAVINKFKPEETTEK